VHLKKFDASFFAIENDNVIDDARIAECSFEWIKKILRDVPGHRAEPLYLQVGPWKDQSMLYL